MLTAVTATRARTATRAHMATARARRTQATPTPSIPTLLIQRRATHSTPQCRLQKARHPYTHSTVATRSVTARMSASVATSSVTRTIPHCPMRTHVVPRPRHPHPQPPLNPPLLGGAGVYLYSRHGNSLINL